MNEKILKLLTPSAKSAFEGMINDYENSLLEKAAEIATKSNTGDVEISLRDLIEAQNGLGSNVEYNKLRRRDKIAVSALLVGITYSALGLVMYLSVEGLPKVDDILSPKYLWMLIVFMGVLFMVMTLLLHNNSLQLSKRMQIGSNAYPTYDSPETIIKMWSMIEKKGAELMIIRGISNSSVLSIYDFLIHELNTRKYIDALNEIITARNNILHTKGFDMKKEDVVHLLKISQLIIDELDKRLSVEL